MKLYYVVGLKWSQIRVGCWIIVVATKKNSLFWDGVVLYPKSFLLKQEEWVNIFVITFFILGGVGVLPRKI